MTRLHALLAIMQKTRGLTQKGHGHVYGASNTADLTMLYTNVDGGSAPTAGDLVAWYVIAADPGASPIVDLSGSGWTQGIGGGATALGVTILAKVVTAGDISAPETIVSVPDGGSIGFWVAYSVTGSVSGLSVSSINAEYPNANAPANQLCDSSALDPPDVAITFGVGGGNDGSPSMSISGATADINFTTAANVWGYGTWEDQVLVNSTVGGASITFSKGDDGGGNHMTSGFVSVTFL